MLTMSSLLLPPEQELAVSIATALDNHGVALSAGGGPHFSIPTWRLMAGALAKQLPALLDFDIVDVFVGAWNKSVAVRQQINKSLSSRGKDVFVQLAEHTIKSKHDPYVALMRGGREVARVPFGVELEIGLQGAVLRILDGAIREIQTARVKGKGTVTCAGAILVQKEIQPHQIPGTLQAPTPQDVRAMLGGRPNRSTAPASEPAADVAINLPPAMPSAGVRQL